MDFAYFQVVRICNQKCIFCAQPSNGRIESLKKIQERIDWYKDQGYEGIILNGGEPTLHKEIVNIIKYTAQKGIYSKMISNGINFSNAELAKACVDAGLKQIHISFHSYIPEVENNLMRGDVYEKQLKGLLNMLLHKNKIDVWVNIVMNQYTIRHLDKTVLFFLKLGVRNFVINNLEVTGVYPEYLEKLLFRLKEAEEPLKKALHLIRKYGNIARVSRIPMCYLRGFEDYSRDIEYYILHTKKYIHYLNDDKHPKQSDFVSDEVSWQSGEGSPTGMRRSRTENCSHCDLRHMCSGYDLLDFFPGEDPLIRQKVDNEEMQTILNNILGKK
ncbi:MAG: hypothetical protein HHAS10_09730 [Candidatus Altimarinota bacterium]